MRVVELTKHLIEALQPFANMAAHASHLDDDERLTIQVTAGQLKMAEAVLLSVQQEEGLSTQN